VGEDVIEPHAVVPARQPVPSGEQVGIRLSKSLLLVGENLQSEAGVQFGVIQPAPPQRPVLVVFHQVVIGIAGKGERVEAERVHRRQPQQSDVGVGGPQVGQVEVDEVVPQHEVRAVGQLVQPGQRRRQTAAAGKREGFIGVWPHTSESMDAAVVPTDFQIQRQATRQGIIALPVERIYAKPTVAVLIPHPGDCSEDVAARPFVFSRIFRLTRASTTASRITGKPSRTDGWPDDGTLTGEVRTMPNRKDDNRS